ncbi:hypothetical protein ACHQM5_023119 [Ranunculus cassubicifolius]
MGPYYCRNRYGRQTKAMVCETMTAINFWTLLKALLGMVMLLLKHVDIDMCHELKLGNQFWTTGIFGSLQNPIPSCRTGHCHQEISNRELRSHH